MKTRAPAFRYFITCAIVFVASIHAVRSQTEATTEPVGIIELPVAGGGTPAAPKISLLSPTLTNPVLSQSTVTGVSGNTLTFSGNPFTANQFNGAAGSHYVEIISTQNTSISGTLVDITATGTSTITTAQATGAVVGDIVKVRKDVTISDLFGATNSAGLLGSNDASVADEVLIYSGSSATSYFYYTGSEVPVGWYASLSGTPAGNVSIAPNEAVVIKRKASNPLNIQFSGAVKTGDTLIPILNGLNVLGTASAKGLTLATSNLYTGNSGTGVKATNDASTADEILLYSSNAVNSYFYYTGDAQLPPGWYHSTAGTAANDIPIAPGTAFVLKRKGAGAAFNWVLPSPTSF